jgi:chemotaxis response regulator CheB
VLIADDAPAMRAALRGLLEDNGLPVIGEAADGLQAVTMAADLQPDIVVMDVRMPGLDGLTACCANPCAPVVPHVGGCAAPARCSAATLSRPPVANARL